MRLLKLLTATKKANNWKFFICPWTFLADNQESRGLYVDFGFNTACGLFFQYADSICTIIKMIPRWWYHTITRRLNWKWNPFFQFFFLLFLILSHIVLFHFALFISCHFISLFSFCWYFFPISCASFLVKKSMEMHLIMLFIGIITKCLTFFCGVAAGWWTQSIHYSK